MDGEGRNKMDENNNLSYNYLSFCVAGDVTALLPLHITGENEGSCENSPDICVSVALFLAPL